MKPHFNSLDPDFYLDLHHIWIVLAMLKKVKSQLTGGWVFCPLQLSLPCLFIPAGNKKSVILLHNPSFTLDNQTSIPYEYADTEREMMFCDFWELLIGGNFHIKAPSGSQCNVEWEHLWETVQGQERIIPAAHALHPTASPSSSSPAPSWPNPRTHMCSHCG